MQHPELGFIDEGQDLTASAFYEPLQRPYGQSEHLAHLAYRSKVFADLEDEKIWTRCWVAVGWQQLVAEPGDMLPFTVGNHGIHIQREPDGSLIGRFNKAQHGGCRAIPAQCQTGYKTKCSFTSCGYSRDRDVIGAHDLEEDRRTTYQYLGDRPDRLLPVRVETRGGLIFVNLDREEPSLAEQIGDLRLDLGEVLSEDLEDRGGFWLEKTGNWKLTAAAIMEHLGASDIAEVRGSKSVPPSHCAARLARGCGAGDILWVFPNLFLMCLDDLVVSVILQPTSYADTLQRIRVFVKGSDVLTSSDLLSDVKTSWRNRLNAAAEAASTLQKAVEADRDEAAADLGSPSLACHAFQRFLAECLLAEHRYYWANPLFSQLLR
jgi:hypothetical protein